MARQAKHDAELCRLAVTSEMAEQLRALSEQMGLPEAWIRRRALEVYLAANEAATPEEAVTR